MMAFKKTLAQRLFNISKISPQTLRNCRISSSAVHTRPAPKPRETSIAPDPGDNVIFRRFLHKRSSAATSQRPEMWSLPTGENLMQKLRVMAIGSDRIRLDCLAPPEREQERSPAVGSGLTAEETRKLLRVAQLEAVKSKLREVQKSWVSYPEFVRICKEGCSDPDLGLGFAKSLDENGSVIVLGNAVCLRPEQVAKAIQELIPIPGAAAVNPNDPRIRELEDMERQKFEIDRKAESLVRRELWCGLAYLVVQTAGFMRLTFWELSWDVMEPICFYVTSMYFMAGYAFFLRTSKEPSFEGFFQSRFHAKQKRLMKLQNFDEGRYNELRKACYPYSSSSSSELPASTAFDGPKSVVQFGSIHS
ncbi:PREDICTED: calcium uniporter protein 2, mitochondrial [Prunus mume]|uniref:Calcium uniporter protein 2, mitochondrial n=1 Tax=Prunus mume TaxID=102107 RepID=A0ABM0PM80_PRUMU|nr:PREDICTED: calcium uniporter protein 2, mitochondrial [Prunus mume]